MENLQKYINKLYRASVSDREKSFRDRGLAGYQLSYILHIVMKPGISHEQLAKSLLVNKSTVTRQVKQLIENEFVKREIDPKDNRKKLLFPTAKAKNIYPEIREYLNTWNNYLISDLNEEERELILELLRKLTKHLSSKFDDEIYK